MPLKEMLGDATTRDNCCDKNLRISIYNIYVICINWMAAQTPRGNNVKANKVEEKGMNAKDSHLKCRSRLKEQRRDLFLKLESS